MDFSSLTIDQLLQRAAGEFERGDKQAVRECLRRILELDPNHFEALHISGVLALEAGNPDEAEVLIRKALSVDPAVAEAHYNLAKVLQENGRLDDAANSYRKAVELQAQLDPAWFNLGLIENQRGNLQEAARAFERAAEIDPHDPNYAFNLGNALFALGDLSGALREFERTVQLHPQHVHAWNNLGIVLRESGDMQASLSAYHRALEVNPEFADAHFNLGNLHEALGHPERALTSYQSAVEANPRFAKALNNLGNIYYSLKQFDRAREVYEQSVSLDPANDSARHMLNSMQGVTTDSAPREYVKRLFDKAAPEFEERLVESLRYRSPSELRQLLDEVFPADGKFASAVDLGCGTGLSGEAFRSRAERLVGVDLSGNMVEKARAKNIYEELKEDDLIGFLNGRPDQFDLFIATDVLVYLGDLRPLFQAVQRRAAEAAWFLFSVEGLDEGEFILRPTGRYAHSEHYIDAVAREFGFTRKAFQDTVVRMENDRSIPGYNVILRYG